MIRTTALATLALGAVLTLGGTAEAGGWRWVEGQTCYEDRVVVVPGHYETRQVTVTDPGRYETRTRQVWVPGCVVYETRTRTIPAEVSIGRKGVRISVGAPRVVTERVAVQKPGRWET